MKFRLIHKTEKKRQDGILMRTDERRKDFIRPQLGKGRCGVCWRRGRGGGSIGPKRPRKARRGLRLEPFPKAGSARLRDDRRARGRRHDRDARRVAGPRRRAQRPREPGRPGNAGSGAGRAGSRHLQAPAPGRPRAGNWSLRSGLDFPRPLEPVAKPRGSACPRPASWPHPR